jgi:hypothetical protein
MTPHEWMLVILAVVAAFVVISFWRFHRNNAVAFNGLDLIMVDGKVDRIATVFMIAFAVSTWVIVDMQIKGKLDSSVFGLWLGAWVGPLVAKMVFGKNDMSAITSSTTVVQQATEVTKP